MDFIHVVATNRKWDRERERGGKREWESENKRKPNGNSNEIIMNALKRWKRIMCLICLCKMPLDVWLSEWNKCDNVGWWHIRSNEDQLLPLISAHTHPKYSLIHLYSGASIEIHAKLNLMSSCSLCSFYSQFCMCYLVGSDCLNIKIQLLSTDGNVGCSGRSVV